VEAPFESRENPKRRKRSDDEYKTPTIHRLSNTAPPREYTKPVTTTISLGNTPASGGEEEALLTASETRTAQALDAIPVEPVKRTGEDADKSAEPTTTTAPKKDNLGTASLTAIEKETHKTQTQTGSTDEVWQSHRNRKSNKVPHSLQPGTSYKQHVETSIETLGNRKRKGGSDAEVRATRHDTTRTAPAAGNSSKQQIETIIEPNDTTSRPDSSKCIQVGNNTFVLRTQPETPSTHHVEESIVFYDSSQTKKRRLSSGIRKRMKFHPQ
jgi:hypothetical protein